MDKVKVEAIASRDFIAITTQERFCSDSDPIPNINS